MAFPTISISTSGLGSTAFSASTLSFLPGCFAFFADRERLRLRDRERLFLGFERERLFDFLFCAFGALGFFAEVLRLRERERLLDLAFFTFRERDRLLDFFERDLDRLLDFFER